MSRRRRDRRTARRVSQSRSRLTRYNPNFEPPNATIHARRKNLSQRCQGLSPRIAALQTQVRQVAELARDTGCSFTFSTLAKIQHALTELARDCDTASREVWS